VTLSPEPALGVRSRPASNSMSRALLPSYFGMCLQIIKNLGS
jgi:hypothetical protein